MSSASSVATPCCNGGDTQHSTLWASAHAYAPAGPVWSWCHVKEHWMIAVRRCLRAGWKSNNMSERKSTHVTQFSTSHSHDFAFGNIRIPASQVFHESPLSYACVNLKPVLPGHVLVLPKRTVRRVRGLTSAEVADLWLTAQRVSGVVERMWSGDGLTFAIQDGEAAGQTVPHVHIHVIPRKYKDLQRNDEIYDRLEEHAERATAMDLADREPRTPQAMAEEASLLRERMHCTQTSNEAQ